VLEAVYEPFLARLIEATRSLRVGPAEDPSAFVGPVIDAEARDRILAAIAKGKQDAKLSYAGELPAGLADDGYFVAPHVFANVPPDASIAQDEIFGPVLAVIRARDLTDALNIANGTAYALTGGIFSRSPANIERVRRDFVVGNLYINRKITGALVERQPFGGFKLSGVGSKAGGPDYLQQFMVPRVITENTLRHGFAPTSGNEPAGECWSGRSGDRRRLGRRGRHRGGGVREMRDDPEQLRRVHRLGKVRAEPRRDAAGAIFFPCVSRQRQRGDRSDGTAAVRRRRRRVADDPDQVEPVFVRHGDVADDDVWPAVLERRDRFAD